MLLRQLRSGRRNKGTPGFMPMEEIISWKRTVMSSLHAFNDVARVSPSYDASLFHDVFLPLKQPRPLSWPCERCAVVK
jgi:hypothetical protein